MAHLCVSLVTALHSNVKFSVTPMLALFCLLLIYASENCTPVLERGLLDNACHVLYVKSCLGASHCSCYTCCFWVYVCQLPRASLSWWV